MTKVSTEELTRVHRALMTIQLTLSLPLFTEVYNAIPRESACSTNYVFLNFFDSFNEVLISGNKYIIDIKFVDQCCVSGNLPDYGPNLVLTLTSRFGQNVKHTLIQICY